jgi:hypothetical protein
MSRPTEFIAAVPVLASLDIERSAEFFATVLGFTKGYVAQGAYGIVTNGSHIAEATSCRVQVRAIESLYRLCESRAVVHPKARLETKPWGTKEFAILDPDGNLVTFYENTDA